MFDEILGSNFEDSDDGFDGPIVSNEKEQKFSQVFNPILLPIDDVDALMNEDIIENQRTYLTGLDTAMEELKIKNEDDLKSSNVNKFVKEEYDSSRNSFCDLQHLLEMDSYGNT